MKLIGILLLAAMLVGAGVTTRMEALPGEIAEAGIADDTFEDDGYDGQWATVEALDVEIFLPEGWTGEDVAEGDVCYRAASADGAASLSIAYPVEGGAAGEVVSANGKSARLARGEDLSLSLTMELSEDRLALFRFERASEDALSEDLALQIAGSCTDVW